MIDQKEFINVWRKIESPKTGLLFSIIYIVGIPMFFLLGFFDNGTPVFDVVFLSLLFAYLLGMPILWCQSMLKGKAHLKRCPFCGKSFAFSNRELIYRTGQCGRCKKYIFNNSEQIK